jgi:hypothetical protein
MEQFNANFERSNAAGRGNHGRKMTNRTNVDALWRRLLTNDQGQSQQKPVSLEEDKRWVHLDWEGRPTMISV